MPYYNTESKAVNRLTEEIRTLKTEIGENTFKLAKKILGLTNGEGDMEHHQPCPICKNGRDRFYYRPAEQTFHCRKCKFSGDIFNLIKQVQQLSTPAAYEAVETAWKQISPSSNSTADKSADDSGSADSKPLSAKKSKQKKDVIFVEGTDKKTAEYIYTDENGSKKHKINRIEGIKKATGLPGKITPQQYFHKGEWLAGAPDMKYPYRLPELLHKDTKRIFVVEGEKTTDKLQHLFIDVKDGDRRVFAVATTSPMGAQNGKQWVDFFERYPDLITRNFFILPDNDPPDKDKPDETPPGMKYAQTVAKALLKANPEARVKIVELPVPQDGSDFVDWYDQQGEIKSQQDYEKIYKEFIALCQKAKWITPETVATWEQPAIAKKSATSESKTKADSGQGKSATHDAPAVLKDFRDIERKPIEWLWRNKFLMGELTVIVGRGSASKSLLTYALASHITNGTPCQQGSVLFFPPEGRESTMRGHIEAAGVNFDYCKMIEGSVTVQILPDQPLPAGILQNTLFTPAAFHLRDLFWAEREMLIGKIVDFEYLSGATKGRMGRIFRLREDIMPCGATLGI